MTTMMTNRQFAAARAHRTQVAGLLAKTSNEVARKALQEALDKYDAILADAPPVKARQVVGKPVKSTKSSTKPAKPNPVRTLAAIKAHRTMTIAKLKGTRGKVRAELQAKIAAYDKLIAA